MFEIDREFFEDEVRDGFLIPSMMKRLWALNLWSYTVLQEECEKAGTFCSGIFGTMLGAIRHGGFIPWDDDMDVEIRRDRYLAIEKLAREGKLPGDHHIGDYITDYGDNMVRRWMTSDSLVVPYEDWKNRFGFPFVCIIDIFLLDFLPTEEKEKRHFWDVMIRAGSLRYQVREMDNRTASRQYARELKQIEWDLGCRFDARSEVPIYIQIMMGMDDFCLSYKDKNCDHLGLTAYCENNDARVIPMELYEHFVKMKFEFGEIAVPAGYDGIMRRNFGDYMTPVLNFNIHSYPVYETMSADAERVAGFGLTAYHYDPEAVGIIRKKRDTAKPASLASIAGDQVSILSEAHVYIRERLASSSGDGNDLLEVTGLVGQCQDLAIGLGEMIEKKAVNPNETVSLLEQYCEDMYSLYQILMGEESDVIRENERPWIALCEKLSVHEEKLGVTVSELISKKKIVILTHKAKFWKGLHTLWQDAVENDYDVTVIAVPYYYRDYEQKIDRETMICETEGYPEEVELTPYDAYDFESEHPDRIICQFPYDEYGGAYVLHPYYYMSNLYALTDELVLIPPFQLREIGKKDIQPRYTWGTYLKTPGVILADTILVQSENMKKTSIDILSEFTGTDPGCEEWKNRFRVGELPIQIWESRARVLISDKNGRYLTKSGDIVDKTVYDDILRLNESTISKLLKPDGGVKKVLLYRLGGSMLYEYGVDEVRRAEQSVSIMESHTDELLTIWIEDPYAEPILRENRPEVWQAYTELRDDFIKHDCGVLIPPGENLDDILRLADAMYGDACPEMNEMRIMGKPVMWATPGIGMEG